MADKKPFVGQRGVGIFAAVERALATKRAPVSLKEIRDALDDPDVSDAVVRNYVCVLTVNDGNRRLHHNYRHQHDLRSDQGHHHDRLIKRKATDGSVAYEFYDHHRDGVWELFPDWKGKPRRVEVDQVTAELAVAEREMWSHPVDDSDTREWLMRSVAARRGHPRFRAALLEAYDRTCAITGCTIVEILEAAHIKPARGQHTMRTDNGLLLRTDVHSLFDLGRLWIDAETMTVGVASVLNGSDYEALRDKPLRAPECAADRPLREHLDSHRAWAMKRPT